MEVEDRPRKLRIISGRIELLEESLNRLLSDYHAIVWSFAPLGDEMHGTVVLLHQSVLTQQMLAQTPAMRRN